MSADLELLIRISGSALEAEDRFLLGSITANQRAYPNGKGGILRINNERYYQFIVARALASSFPYPVSVELGQHDLVLKYPEDNSRWYAVVEMKRWMSPEGESEIPRICNDIKKLLACPAENAIAMIFAANPRGASGAAMAWLVNRLSVLMPEITTKSAIYTFETLNPTGAEIEFWVAGIDIRPPTG